MVKGLSGLFNPKADVISLKKRKVSLVAAEFHTVYVRGEQKVKRKKAEPSKLCKCSNNNKTQF